MIRPNDRAIPDGITIREWFAGLALAGLLADPEVDGARDEIAEMAVGFADALIRRLNGATSPKEPE